MQKYRSNTKVFKMLAFLMVAAIVLSACNNALYLPVAAEAIDTVTPTETAVYASATTVPSQTDVPTETQMPTLVLTPTPRPTWTLPAVPIGNLPKGFAAFHLPIEQLPFLKVESVTVTKVIKGQTVEVPAKVISVADGECKGDLLDNVRKVYQAFKAIGADWHTIGAMVLTESGFKQYVTDKAGNCRVLQNYAGAPAFCMMQIYLPAHPGVKEEDLSNIDYCIEVGRNVYAGMWGGPGSDGIQAVACYKGFCQPGLAGKNDPGFVANYMSSYNGDGFSVNGIFVPWDEGDLLKKFPDWKK